MIGIVIDAHVKLSPFAKKYIDVLEERKADYEIIQWDRSGEECEDGDGCYTYTRHTQRFLSALSKTMPFIGFHRYAKKIIKERKYDSLIVLTTQTAFLIFDVLMKKRYKNKYFFDYRDTSYEYIKLYKRLVDKIILNSYCTCISSYGFKKYLTDKKELIIAHNFQNRYYGDRAMHCSPGRDSERIVMGYVGYLREYEYLKKLADAFGRDKRFVFSIHGEGDCVQQLREYTEKYENVEVHGAYREEEKMDIVDSFDMICYNYPYSFVNYPAMANKFYDGMIRKKPMFGNSATLSGELLEKYGLGISLPEDESDITDKIYDYYSGLDKEKFEKNCESFLDQVLREDRIYVEKINEFITNTQ